ncbi:MAG: 4-(cytidine 5'-diphospho)-2-C-methyl-D-erythritol kinase [Planctomycetaceae bacterium]
MRVRRQGASLVVDTPAKLNLFLEVLGRRSDGYHSLETVMVSVGLYDTLQFVPTATPGVSLSVCTSRGLGDVPCPVDDSNLVLKAARLLVERHLQTLGRDPFDTLENAGLPGVAIHLTKRIPLQAGMGGGSSDAAAALVGLNRFWNLGFASVDLHELASRLGSDVNVFLDSVPLALCRGRGEQIESRPLGRRYWVVVAQPPVGLSTAAVFRHWQPQAAPRCATPVLQMLAQGRLPDLQSGVFNALQQPAELLSDEVSQLLGQLRDAGGVVSGMTGSGSACYAIGQTYRACQTMAARLRARGGYWVGVMRCST